MIKFAELLSRIMRDKNIAVYDLASFIGVDRSFIYKVVKGTRNPSNRKMVEKIADYLCLGHAERSELIDSYYFTVLGERRYYGSKQIIRMFNQIGRKKESGKLLFQISLKSSQRKPMILNNHDDIQDAVLSICMTAGQRDNEKIRIFSSSYRSVTTYLLNGVCRSFPDTRIEHIVILDDGMRINSDHRLYNIDCISMLLPLVILFPGYHLQGLYTSSVAIENMGMQMSEMVITDGYVCVFDQLQDHGILISNPDIIQVYDDIFKNIEKRTMEFVSRISQDSIFDTVKLATFGSSTAVSERERNYSFNPGICAVDLLDENEAYSRKHYKLEEPELSRFIERFHAYLPEEQRFLQELGIHELCSRQGIENFAESGYINEINPSDMTPLDTAERIEVLREWRTYYRRGNITMVNLPELEGDAQISIVAKTSHVLLQITSSETGFLIGIISEVSFVSMIRWFCEFIEQEYRMDDEEVFTFLDECEARLKQKLQE